MQRYEFVRRDYTYKEKRILYTNGICRADWGIVSTVNRWETGKMSPNVSTMKRLKAYCEALNIEFGNVEDAWLAKATNQENKEEDK